MLTHTTITRLLCAAALAASPVLGHAFNGVDDNANDFLPTFAGSTSSTDLDVISATVLYNPVSDIFTLSSTLNGAVGSTPTGVYVWGVNRGSGVASFAPNGIDGVLFDRVVLLRPDGTGAIGGGVDLAAGSVTISGNTITGMVSGSLLESTGFKKSDYTWNLWPRDLAFASQGFAAISDFAPNNANFTSTVAAVPEPGTYAMLLAGLAVVGFAARRRGTARMDERGLVPQM